MNRLRIQIMNQFDRKSHEYKALKRYWKLIQQDSRKLSDKRFYRPTFRSHLTNKEIVENILRLVVKKSPTGESTHYFFFMLK